MAPVVHQLESAEGVESRVCSTGQHREMLDPLLDLFDIEPDHDLEVMAEDQSPSEVMARILEGLDSALEVEDPDWVLVQGDTSTVAAASIGAFYNEVQVGHVEAGLRTGDKWNPFPEEINRRVAGVVADHHFAPTPEAKENLLTESVQEERITVTGNTVIDALQWVADSSPPAQVDEILDESSRTILVTAHRRENHGEPLARICDAIEELISLHNDLQIVYSVHLNPNVWDPVKDRLEEVSQITLVPPLDYPVLVHLMNQSDIVLTDSGGIQEEAPSLGKPVLVLREKTERPEGIEAGTVELVGTDTKQIVSRTTDLLENPEVYSRMAQASNPYGDGEASRRTVEALVHRTTTEFSP